MSRIGSMAPASGPQMLARGVLVIRWALLVWMTVLAVSGAPQLPPVALRVTTLLVVVAWTVVVTARLPGWSPPLLLGDLLVAVAVAVIGIRYPAFATVYPAMAALQWGTARGVSGGVAAGGGGGPPPGPPPALGPGLPPGGRGGP